MGLEVFRFEVKRVRAIGLRVQSVLGFGCTQIWCVPRAQGLPVGLGIEVEAPAKLDIDSLTPKKPIPKVTTLPPRAREHWVSRSGKVLGFSGLLDRSLPSGLRGQECRDG